MSNQWLRLWHDMPNDPKFRTVARISKQRIGDVQAVFLHLLVSASQHVTRGHVDVTAEDLASAIDVTDDAIQAILDAMQGRMMDGNRLTGWEKRQPKREDSGDDESGAKSASQRKKEQREREKAAAAAAAGKSVNGSRHAASRNVTTDTDKDTEKEKEHTQSGERDMATGEPDGSVCVFVCQKMQEVGVKDANASDGGLAVLVGKGADVGVFVDAAKVAVGQGKGFAYALGIVKNKMTAAAALANAALAAPVAAAPSVGKPDVSRVTVPMSPNAQAALRQLDVDAAIPRSGPSAEVRQKMAMLKGAPVAVAAARQAGAAAC